jgi:hypothetical protein
METGTPREATAAAGASCWLRSLGKLYRRTGEREQAHEHLTKATAMYREMDMVFWLEQAEVEVRELTE